MNNQKALGSYWAEYAETSDQWVLPHSMDRGIVANADDVRWFEFMAYRAVLGGSTLNIPEKNKTTTRQMLVCPADSRTTKNTNNYQNVEWSYSYNAAIDPKDNTRSPNGTMLRKIGRVTKNTSDTVLFSDTWTPWRTTGTGNCPCHTANFLSNAFAFGWTPHLNIGKMGAHGSSAGTSFMDGHAGTVSELRVWMGVPSSLADYQNGFNLWDESATYPVKTYTQPAL